MRLIPQTSYISSFFKEIKVHKTVFNLLEIVLDKVFVSTFNNEIGVQFFIFCLS